MELHSRTAIDLQELDNLKWLTVMKVRLAEIDKKERERRRGFMRRVKERWDEEFPENSRIKPQTYEKTMQPDLKRS